MVYTTVCQVIYAILLAFVHNLCELVRTIFAKHFSQTQGRQEKANNHVIMRTLKSPVIK